MWRKIQKNYFELSMLLYHNLSHIFNMTKEILIPPANHRGWGLNWKFLEAFPTTILFFNKWEAVADPVTLQVISHFKTNWNDNHLAKWSRCHAPNCIVNNNGLEAMLPSVPARKGYL